MQNLVSFIEKKLAPPLIKISQNRYLDSIQKAFMIFMPYLLVSSLFLLVASFPIPGWAAIVKPIAPQLNQVVNSTLGVIAVGISITFGFYLGKFYSERDQNVSPISCALVSVISFLMLFPITITPKGDTIVNAAYFGSTGLFTAIITTILSVEIFRFVINRKLVIKMPEQVPPMISQSFTAVIPAFAVVLFWFVINYLLKINLPGLTDKIFAPLLVAGASPFAQFLAFILDRVLWFVGIHGSNVVGSVMSPIWTQMMTTNINDFAAGKVAPYLYTSAWVNNVARVSVVPLVILMMTSKVKAYKTLGKMAIVPAIFNIAEPIMFGLPLVLNPILFIPWVLGYGVVFGVSYFFTGVVHLIGPMVADVPWTIPGPIAAYLGTNGQIWPAVISLLNLVIMFFIWLPFFKVMERAELAKEGNLDLEKVKL